MDGSYSLEELLTMLDECLIDAHRWPFGKRDLVDTDKMTQIIDRIRRMIPDEIDNAKRIVADKNQIIHKARQEAEAIIKDAEKRRAEMLNQSEIYAEACDRAKELLSEAQSRANQMYASANGFADSTFSYIEQVLTRDLEDVRMLRTNLANSGNVAGAQAQKAQAAAKRPAQIANSANTGAAKK